MDQLVIVQGVAEIGPASPEVLIALPTAEWANLIDIRLQLQGVLALPPVDNDYYNPKGINIWFGTRNITSDFKRLLIRDLTSQGAKAKKAFSEAITSIRAYWKAHPLISAQARLISDADFAKVEAASWVTHFASLGDDTTGPAGGYHAFNYIFGPVAAKPMSFREAFEPASDPRVPILQDWAGQSLRITASDSLLAANPAGNSALKLTRPLRVRYFVELVYKNPFEELVAAELENLNSLLSATGPIQTAIAKQASTLQTLKDELWQTSLKAQGLPAAVERLEKLIEDVRPDLKSRS